MLPVFATFLGLISAGAIGVIPSLSVASAMPRVSNNGMNSFAGSPPIAVDGAAVMEAWGGYSFGWVNLVYADATVAMFGSLKGDVLTVS